MESMTIQELKTWVKTNQHLLKGLNIRITTAKKSLPFKTLKSFGEYILQLENENYTSARISGFHYVQNPRQQAFKNDAVEKLTAGNISGIEIMFGGKMSTQEILILAQSKTQKIKNNQRFY